MSEESIPVWLDPTWRQWREAVQGGRLPHALLVTGPAGVGKRWLVNAFVRGVQCREPSATGLPCGNCPSCKQYVSWRQLETKSHPDIDWLTIDRYSIGIMDIRDQIIQRLTLKANYGRLRLLVVEPAERMTLAASNALLKSLEEPPPGAALFLISHHPGRLLPTIRSRCQKYVVACPTREQAMEWLLGSMSETQAESALAASGGMPVQASQMHLDGQVDFRRRFEKDLTALLEGKQLETVFASTWNPTPGRNKKSTADEDSASEDSPMDLRLVWMIERAVAEARERAEGGSATSVRAAVQAYQDLVAVRRREALVPSAQLNLEAACLAITKMVQT